LLQIWECKVIKKFILKKKDRKKNQFGLFRYLKCWKETVKEKKNHFHVSLIPVKDD